MGLNERSYPLKPVRPALAVFSCRHGLFSPGRARNTLTVMTPALSAGSQRVTITNPDGQIVLLDGAFTTN